MRIELFSSGMTMAIDNGRQVAEAQQAWIICFAEYLDRQGIDPTEHEIILPDGSQARFFRTGTEVPNAIGSWQPSLNWEIVRP